jgi:hypothetical protein
LRIHKAFIFVSLIIALGLGCQKSENTRMDVVRSESTDLKDLEWIVGTWQRQTSRGTMYENWKMVNDTIWRGRAYRLAETDTMILEELSLEIRNDEIFYVPVVPHDKGAVYFKMIKKFPDTVIFENPDHDFPQRIIYMKMPNDSLHARIEGMDEGVETSTDFYFKRVN